MGQAQLTYVNYTGSSMEPILKPGDLLQVLAHSGSPVRRGDVIFYSCPSKNCNIVHRVTDFDTRGIRTRGDNNAHIDPWVVSLEQVVGYVAHAQRGQRWRRIQGGCIGRLAVKSARALKHVSAWTDHTMALLQACRAIS